MRIRTALLALVVSLAIGVPAASAGAAPPAAASAAPSCRTANLVVWLRSSVGSGAAGSVYYKLQLTNLGTATCSLNGYPGVAAVDLSGKRIGAVATHEPGKTPHPVTLKAGETATAQLRLVEAGNFSPSSCHETIAAGMRVSLPGQSGSKLVPLPFATCSRSSQPTISIAPIAKPK